MANEVHTFEWVVKTLKTPIELVVQQFEDYIEKGLLTCVSLDEWASRLDPITYQKMDWKLNPEMDDINDAYKAASRDYHVKRRIFYQVEQKPADQRFCEKATPEDYERNLAAALAWAEAALRAGKGRVEFLEMYPFANDNPRSVAGHIKQGRQAIKSGKTAVEKVKRYYKEIWLRHQNQVDPTIFR